MLADSAHFREVDLSHLTRSSIAELETDLRSNSTIGYLLVALFVSVLLHSLLLLWQVEKPAQYTPAKRIHLNLNRIYEAPKEISKPAAKPEEPVTVNNKEQVAAPVVDTPVMTAPAPTTPDDSLSNVEQKPRIITSLSRDEMHEIYNQRNATSASPKTDSISRNVFNPALRERLITEENKPDLQRANIGPKTHMDPSGATVVELGNGKCLRSSVVTKAGETQNWYMTSCGGKSDSERMMERINDQVNGKLRFDE